MPPPSDFCVLILTHGRPDHVLTASSLERSGYTGPVYFVVDDEDAALAEYRRRYGDQVVTFSKADIAARFDEADNFAERRSIFYARNAAFDIAEDLGFTYFIQLDDDYSGFYLRAGAEQQFGNWTVRDLDTVFGLVLDYYKSIPASTLCFGQGGDYLGGAECSTHQEWTFKRKAMNTFICSTARRFAFQGKVNEDVNTYTEAGRRGLLFITFMPLMITQATTQQRQGGMTELYLDGGTYRKSFYSILYAPSCVKIGVMGNDHPRIHHAVDWKTAVPVIVPEHVRKPDPSELTA